MAFNGWPAQAVEFYDGLEEDNSREYWHSHKAVYSETVLRPMEELLEELSGRFGPGRIFRPNRDVRFSADKSPYKTAIAATLSGGGYTQFSAAGLAAGRGMYMMAPDQLERYRRAVDTDPAGSEVARLTKRPASRDRDHRARPAETAPRGFARDHPRIDLLRLGPDRLAAVAGGRLDVHLRGQVPGGRFPGRHRAAAGLAGPARRPQPAGPLAPVTAGGASSTGS
jgi:uncharacterized protein (TIGR02453 family)